MIKIMRLDERLIHGQVALSWVKDYNIHIVLIVNDKVVNDAFLKMTLGLAKPPGVELKIVNVEDGINLIKQYETSSNNVMIIVNNTQDVKRIVDNTNIKSVNFGNLSERTNSKRVSNSVTLTPEDIEICKELIDKGIELEIRWVANDRKQLIKNLI